MTTLIDARYYGGRIRHARRTAHINTRDAARMFKISPRDMARIEQGKVVPDERILLQLLYHGFVFLYMRNSKIIK